MPRGLWRFKRNDPLYRAKRAFVRAMLDPIRRKGDPEAVTALLQRLGITGVGIGEKYEKGLPTGKPAIKVYVRVKHPTSLLEVDELLPAEFEGFPVDVEETGIFKAQADPNPLDPLNPVVPGCSIGYALPGGFVSNAGTLGALLTDGTGFFLLSNNHVLADLGNIPVGTPVVQPGRLDGGLAPEHEVGDLSRVEPLSPQVWNRMDVAIASVRPGRPMSAEIIQLGRPEGVTEPLARMPVEKYGKSTRYRAGTITSVDADVPVDYGGVTYWFLDQVVIEGTGGIFSDGGDSGALVLDRNTGKAVALLFAGTSTYSLASPLPLILSRLELSLA